MINIQTGEVWFAKLPGQRKLTPVTVTEVRESIVQLDVGADNSLTKFGLILEHLEWYKTADVEFVEKDNS